MLAVCNHPCQFTYVVVGKVGCVGDAFCYAKISLRRHIVVGSWLQGNVQDFDGNTVRSYIKFSKFVFLLIIDLIHVDSTRTKFGIIWSTETPANRSI